MGSVTQISIRRGHSGIWVNTGRGWCDESGMTDTPSDLVFPGDSSGESQLWTVGEVAELLRVSRMTIYRMVESEVLASVRIGRAVRIPRTSVEEFLRDARQAHPGHE